MRFLFYSKKQHLKKAIRPFESKKEWGMKNDFKILILNFRVVSVMF